MAINSASVAVINPESAYGPSTVSNWVDAHWTTFRDCMEAIFGRPIEAYYVADQSDLCNASYPGLWAHIGSTVRLVIVIQSGDKTGAPRMAFGVATGKYDGVFPGVRFGWYYFDPATATWKTLCATTPRNNDTWGSVMMSAESPYSFTIASSGFNVDSSTSTAVCLPYLDDHYPLHVTVLPATAKRTIKWGGVTRGTLPAGAKTTYLSSLCVGTDILDGTIEASGFTTGSFTVEDLSGPTHVTVDLVPEVVEGKSKVSVTANADVTPYAAVDGGDPFTIGPCPTHFYVDDGASVVVSGTYESQTVTEEVTAIEDPTVALLFELGGAIDDPPPAGSDDPGGGDDSGSTGSAIMGGLGGFLVGVIVGWFLS